MPAKLIVTRKHAWFNRSKPFTVVVDGKEVGSIKNDSSQEFEIPAGTHEIRFTLNWVSSAMHTVDVTEGGKTFIKVSNGMKYITPLYVLMFIGIFFPFYFKFSKIPMPDVASVIKLVLILPAIIYIILYTTVLRNKYLVIEQDNSNPFS